MHILTIISGFVSGCLSGMFGVGGGIITTPAIRLLLNQPAAIAIGTPLPVMIPAALTGAYNYSKKGLIDWKLAKPLTLSGLAGIIAGSIITKFVQPKLIMLATAVVIGFVSFGFLKKNKFEAIYRENLSAAVNHGALKLIIGFICGFFSGFLGLGGGILLIPSLNYIFKKDIRTSFGTSLAIVSVFTVPGTIIHSYLGHVDFLIAFFLAVGVIPGAYAGSKLALILPVRLLRFFFGLLLLTVAAYLAIYEIWA